MMDETAFPSYLFQTEKNTSDNPLAFLSDMSGLKNIISYLSKQISYPVALIDYKAFMKRGKSEKLESTEELFSMRKSCRIFRKCAGENYCVQCDYFHARCMDVDKVTIERHIQESIARAPSFFSPTYKRMPPKVLENFDRPVIEYHCPMLGFRELLFPLMYGRSIYGVIFVGQIIVYSDDDQKINKEICECFFNNNSPEDLFNVFVKEFNAHGSGIPELDSEAIKALIIDYVNNTLQYDRYSSKKEESYYYSQSINTQKDFPEYASFTYGNKIYDSIMGFMQSSKKKEKEYFSKNFKTQKSYYAFIRKVCKKITETEKILSAAYEERRFRIVSETMEQTALKHFEKWSGGHIFTLKNKHEVSIEELKRSWQTLKHFASDILRQYKSLRKIFLFGDKQGIRVETTSEREIVFAVPVEKRNLEGFFDFSVYNINGINDYTNSLEKPELLAGLSKELQKQNSILIQCHDIAMLIQVRDLEDHKELYACLADTIGKALVRFNSIIALCSANLTKEKYLLTLRMYRHENAHMSTRLMDNINRYFAIENGGQRFLDSDESKRKLVCNDLKNTVQFIANVADNISFITGTGIAADDARKAILPFNMDNMLYKWQIMFQDELEKKNLEIIVYRGGNDLSAIGYQMAAYLLKRDYESTQENDNFTIAPSVITINARLLELLVYNIVDNAVKYAYIGTNIYLIWGRLENDYELSVTSYGPRMPEGDAMYGLYVRGNEDRSVSGDGLGLYVVKKIAEKLGLKVIHDSETISRYNAPLIPWYINTDFSDMKGYSKIQENELTTNNNTHQVFLATNSYPPTKIKETDLTSDYLKASIKMETWRTTFRIMIPIIE